MTWRWFTSKTVRQAVTVRKHVHRLLSAQRDLLSPQAIEAVGASEAELQTAIHQNAPKEQLVRQMENIEKVANKWLKPFPNAAWRENVEVFLVALAVAMAIRTFFLQPFKIPTGSMQPTLFGVTSDNLINRPDIAIPTGLARVREWFQGISYVQVFAKNSGAVEHVSNPVRFLIFSLKQTITIGGRTQTIWFPPDYGGEQQPLPVRAGLQRERQYAAGEQVIRLKVQSGDHLFVDRLTYNFRQPERGEILVFQTAGINPALMPQDQFYIKRMVAMGGETVQIGNDRHLRINGKRLDASNAPHFENVYSFDPKSPPRDSEYSGHVNGRYGLHLAPLFPNEDASYTLPPNTYMVMGDNTVNSKDSREWGEFPATNVIGKSFFVYWPITARFGWGHR